MFVVWEPVLPTDQVAPATSVLALVPDLRVRQFWDRERLLSAHMVRAAAADPERDRYGWPMGEGEIVWDYIGVFPPGSRWEATLPAPAYAGSPLTEHMEQVARRL